MRSRSIFYLFIFSFALTLISMGPLAAQQSLQTSSVNTSNQESSFEAAEEQDRELTYRAPQVDVIGAGSEALEDVPGSGVVIDKETLELEQPVSAQQALRRVPGVNVRGEDSAGLITNIGIRGLSPDRSEKVLFLEDGMPAGLAPYTENAAYYTPPVERMERLELLKGSGSILFGPQTIGGVLNFITPPVPEDYRASLRFDGGNEKYLMGIGRFGKTWGPVGLDVSVLYKQGDGWTRRDENFRVANFTGKLLFDVSDNTKITVKNNYQDQSSKQSYLGLTSALFEEDARFNPVPFDQLDLSRYDLQVTLQHFFSDNIEFLTNIYYWNATRNWNRQDFARNNDFDPAPANTVRTVGDTSVDGGAIYLRESFGSRDRDFQGAGIEPRVMIDYDAFGQQHHMHAGARFHFEELTNERNNRATLISDPVLRDRDVRRAYAFAFFFQNTFQVTDDLQVIPGFRLEQFTQTRDFTRQDNMDVDFGNSTSNTVLIPGLGITYQMPGSTTFFTGIHRGFAPPRTSQAIGSDGQDLELQPEFSWNFEAGFRTNPWPFWQAEATFFLMDFTNQVIPASESGGASNLLTNAGQTRHIGAEFSSSLDLLGLAGADGEQQFFLDTRYTFVDARNVTDGGTFEGNLLPYAPQHILSLGGRYFANSGPAKGLSLGLESLFVSSQFADQANTVLASADGTVGEIPSYWLVNTYARYFIPKTRLQVNVAANNLLNNTFIISRAPQGIFPGAGMQLIGGLQYDFFGPDEKPNLEAN